MANFNEHALELSIMELFKDEGYTSVSYTHSCGFAASKSVT